MKCPEPLDILIFIDWYLPGYKAGGPIVSCANMVRALRPHYRIGLVCSDRDYLSESAHSEIVTDQWVQRDGIYLCYLSPPAMRYEVIADLVRNNDKSILYINGIFSRVFSIYPLLAARRGKQRIVLSPRGMLAPGAMGIKSLKKNLYLAFAKILGLFGKVEFHATHTHEEGHIRSQLAADARITVLPNLASLPGKTNIKSLKPKAQDALHILMVARIAAEKNILFALECLAALPERFSIQAAMVGPVYSEAYMQQCREVQLPQNVQVEWCGALPPSLIAERYVRSHLFFLPTLGENYGHAIVEAMLHGLPVLVSDQTPWRNLQADGLGADLPLSDEAAFLKYICHMASMNEMQYHEACRHIAATAMKRIHFSDTVAAYKSFFA